MKKSVCIILSALIIISSVVFCFAANGEPTATVPYVQNIEKKDDRRNSPPETSTIFQWDEKTTATEHDWGTSEKKPDIDVPELLRSIFGDKIGDLIDKFSDFKIDTDALYELVIYAMKTTFDVDMTIDDVKDLIKYTQNHGKFDDWLLKNKNITVVGGVYDRLLINIGIALKNYREKKSTTSTETTTKGNHEFNPSAVPSVTTTVKPFETKSTTARSTTKKATTTSSDKNIRGDVDGDGKVTAIDARLALRASAKLQELSARQFIIADINGDGDLTAGDARKILRISAKLEK